MWKIIKNNNPTLKSACDSDLNARDLNNFFINIPEDIVTSLPKANKDALEYLEKHELENAFAFREITFNNIRSIIENLKNSNSKDPYRINVKIIKVLKNNIIIPLTKLINLCIRRNVFPRCLKIAKVVPVFKRGSRTNLSSYTPISLVPTFSKVFESVLEVQITAYFEDNNLFSSCQ